MKKDTSIIPTGPYCYNHTGESEVIFDSYFGLIKHPKIKVCPYWEHRPDKPEQESGYCSFMDHGDWQDEVGLLWDHIKECGINEEIDEEWQKLHED